jgi:hypothetical protein
MHQPPTLSELLRVFAMTEAEQERYFPELAVEWYYDSGDVDVRTPHAREIALAGLRSRAKAGELSSNAEYAALCGEIAALAAFVHESSESWPYLLWHPRIVREDAHEGIAVDWELYPVWDVVRRLCRAALACEPHPERLRPFPELFAAHAGPLRR